MSVTELLCRLNTRLIISTILFLTFRMVVESEEVCNGTINLCCKGYFRNFETNKCEKCTPGYTGPNCTAECPYPTYGFACQGFCNCSNDTCNMSWGCITSTTLTTEENMTSLEEDFQKNDTKYKTYISGQSFGTTKSNLVQQKSEKLLLLFIRIIGCLDIMLLCAYLTLCIHDRAGQEKTMDIASPHPNFPGRSTAYENIEVASFSVSGIN